MTEEDFELLIDLIDDLRGDAFNNKRGLEMLDNKTVNQIRRLVGLRQDNNWSLK